MTRTRLLLAAALALLCAAPRAQEDPAAPKGPAPIVVRVYHTNDVHGWIMSRADRLQSDRQLGGAPAFKSLLDRDASAKLVLDAGDWWQGTPEGSLTKGEASAEVFNAVGYDAAEVGNHEFDAGQDSLKSLILKMKMPVLAANVYGPDGKHVPWTKQRIIKEVSGVKFGIFGLVTSHMDHLEVPAKIAGLTFRREVDEARDQVAALKKEGADVIIAVTHVGYEAPNKPPFEGDQTIAREVEGIDLIVGGHSHTSLYHAWRDPSHGTLVVQAGCFLTKVGRTTLKIDPASHRVTASSDELLELWPDRVGEDAGVKAIVARREADLGEAFKLVVATATEDLDRSAAGESGLGSWMADCFKETAGVDAFIMNGGGIRSDIPQGPVTLRRLFEAMPFDDGLVKTELTGAQLRAALDHVIGSPKIAQIGGMTAEYRQLKPRHERLSAVTVGGAPLDDAKTYSVATLDFLAGSYEEFAAGGPPAELGVVARDALRACAEKQKTIAPPPAGRLKDLGE